MKIPGLSVSVPSRGNGVIDLQESELGSKKVKFPSPLGEMGLSIIVNRVYLDRVDAMVSVPSRGNGVIDLACG